jgi:hypothetical protein
MIILKPTFGKVFCVILNNYYAPPKLVQFPVDHRINIYGTVYVNRSHIPLQVRNMKLNKGKCVAYHR